jgi:tetratricopeptide (TPR) repeat protein
MRCAYLGQVAEETKRYDEAMKYYVSVMASSSSRPRRAMPSCWTAEQAGGGARVFQNVRTAMNNALLIQAKRSFCAKPKLPESYDLLSRRWRSSENLTCSTTPPWRRKLDRIDVVETNLRRLITLKPDHAQAYNALGYTLADRTDRLKEAKGYIEKALKLSPDDPFILDSMGWVLYRLGAQKEALGYLQRAYSLRPDPEIAAHIGEVMWTRGQQQDAEKIWRDASRENPDNEMLQATMKRFLR